MHPTIAIKNKLKQKVKRLIYTLEALNIPIASDLCSLLIKRPESRQLPLPNGISEKELFDFVTSVRVADAPEEEMRNYGTHDFRRFVFTYGLVKNTEGACLELGANPYFTTMLLKKFTNLELKLANYFGDFPDKDATQTVEYLDISSGERLEHIFSFKHFNVEKEAFPWPENTFDVVIFSEIIEHLTNNPCQALREIRRVLKPNGSLILTTPNVARLENVAKIIAGANIYDPYSGYGSYGRHNREYNRHELVTLLQYEGFDCEEHFTVDIHPDAALNFYPKKYLDKIVGFRGGDLGQYIFIKAKKSGLPASKYPTWLYRSMPEEYLEKVVL
jgi:SAM-dependent methyltransferase